MVALVVTTVTLLLVLVSSRHSVLSAWTVIVAAASAAVFVFLEQRRPRVGIRPVLVAIGLVLLVAVALPPRSSNDVWSYTMYGRMVSVHGSSPYQRVPADFRTDPFDKRVSPIWQHRGSVYGPAFVGYAAAVTFIAGDSVTVDRLLFQLGALLVIAAVLWLVWRRTRSPSALAWLGLNPLFGAVIVNNGQIDAFLGLAILAAVLLAYERRGVLAGVAIAAAALVKITGLVALAGIVFWLWRRGERRAAVLATVTTGALVGLVYLPFVTGASHVLNGADHTVTPGSPWNLPAQVLVGKDAGRDLPGLIVHNSTLSTIFYLSLALTAVLAVGLSWRWARSPRPDLAAGVATASYVVAAEYTLPWYAGWALPMFADRRISRLGWVVWAEAVVLLAAWRLPTHHTGGVFDTFLRGTFAYALPIVLLVAFALLPNRGPTDGATPAPGATADPAAIS
jgi:Glycosyltransferase family 87